MTKRFFTSDTHIGHELVARLRGFYHDHPQSGEFGSDIQVADTAAHDAKIAENWDRVVGPDDTVFVLGDISINPKRANAFEWFRNRPGKKHLICGNHDAVAGFHSKALNEQQKSEWANTFATIRDFAFLKIAGHRIALSHYPYDGEGDRSLEDRMTEVRLRDVGLPLLHGHTHASHQAHLSERGTPMFHVGLDAWNLELVPESTIVEWAEYLPRKQNT
jgi:calcineurin-like phosphoesterase family protein